MRKHKKYSHLIIVLILLCLEVSKIAKKKSDRVVLILILIVAAFIIINPNITDIKSALGLQSIYFCGSDQFCIDKSSELGNCQIVTDCIDGVDHLFCGADNNPTKISEICVDTEGEDSPVYDSQEGADKYWFNPSRCTEQGKPTTTSYFGEYCPASNFCEKVYYSSYYSGSCSNYAGLRREPELDYLNTRKISKESQGYFCTLFDDSGHQDVGYLKCPDTGSWDTRAKKAAVLCCNRLYQSEIISRTASTVFSSTIIQPLEEAVLTTTIDDLQELSPNLDAEMGFIIKGTPIIKGKLVPTDTISSDVTFTFKKAVDPQIVLIDTFSSRWVGTSQYPQSLGGVTGTGALQVNALHYTTTIEKSFDIGDQGITGDDQLCIIAQANKLDFGSVNFEVGSAGRDNYEKEASFNPTSFGTTEWTLLKSPQFKYLGNQGAGELDLNAISRVRIIFYDSKNTIFTFDRIGICD